MPRPRFPNYKVVLLSPSLTKSLIFSKEVAKLEVLLWKLTLSQGSTHFVILFFVASQTLSGQPAIACRTAIDACGKVFFMLCPQIITIENAKQRCMIGRDFTGTCPRTNHRNVEEDLGSRRFGVSLSFRKSSQSIPAQLSLAKYYALDRETARMGAVHLQVTFQHQDSRLPTILGVVLDKDSVAMHNICGAQHTNTYVASSQ